jgi:hypothetical protein
MAIAGPPRSDSMSSTWETSGATFTAPLLDHGDGARHRLVDGEGADHRQVAAEQIR